MQLHRARPEIQAAGADLVLIGQATPRHAAHLRRRLGIDLTVLADERLESYRAAGAKVATFGELFGPRPVSHGVRHALRSGGRIRQGRMIGHPAQLGGALAIAPDGTVAWAHMSEDASDSATPEAIVAAVRGAAGPGDTCASGGSDG